MDRALERRIDLDYHGIDLCQEMVAEAARRHPLATLACRDVLDLGGQPTFDYVVCNGVLTQKLHVTMPEMTRFAHAVIRRMFALARVGIAFNIMSTYVNFMVDRLYYRSPVEMLCWCMTELSPRVRLDHAYPLYEYTIYVYRAEAPGVRIA